MVRPEMLAYLRPTYAPAPPPPPRGPSPGVVGGVVAAMLLIVVAVVVAVVANDVGRSAGPVIRNPSSGAPTDTAVPRPDAFELDGRIVQFPPPPAGLSPVPIGTPPPPPANPGPFTFMSTQADGAPVAYDPCRPIKLVVNTRTAVAGAADLLGDALVAVSQATGLHLEIEGTTDEAPSDGRQPVQLDRYGNRWAPVLVAWTDDVEAPALAGDVAGSGGSQSIGSGSGASAAEPKIYVTGTLELDGPQLAEALRRSGRAEVRAIIEHELAHVVGLGHVDDPTQLMAPETHDGVTRFGSGDLAGLSRLGAGPCVPHL